MQNENYIIEIDKSKNNEKYTENTTLESKPEQNIQLDIDLLNAGKNGNGCQKSSNNGSINGNNLHNTDSHNGHDVNLHECPEPNELIHSENGKHDNHRVLPSLENKIDFLNHENTLEVEFQGSRKEFFYNPIGDKIHKGDFVIVETENGCDIGKIISNGEMTYRKWLSANKETSVPVYSIRYKAGPKEIQKHKFNLEEQKKILERAKMLIQQHHLEMKVTEVEWQFDRHRLTLYFLAPQRIDFRELVKDLAKEYKTRIELRQITHRERAKRITLWEGVCGRGICCSTFLHQIKPITIEHSKVQQLSANVTKLSGYCGRLKCCLSFEYDLYSHENERFPKLGSILDFEDFSFKLIKFDIFKDVLTFFSEGKRIYRNFSLEEIREFSKNNKILEPKESHNEICHGFSSHDELQELLKLSD